MALIEKKLEEMGIVLPEAPEPIANYVSVKREGQMLYFSGARADQRWKSGNAGQAGKRADCGGGL